jgi:hypothetical protein
MSLCEHLRLATLRELTQRMTWQDFVLWCGRYRVQPWGEERADGRQVVALSYLLKPHLKNPSTSASPAMSWPYFGDDAASADEQYRLLKEHEAKYAHWNSRPSDPIDIANQ